MSAAAAPRAFAAFANRGYRAHFGTYVLAMMADNIEHVISYWVVFQKFHSPALGGFAVVSHWLPYLLFSVAVGGLADRFDPRRLIQFGMGLFMAVSVAWGVLFFTDTLQMWQAMVLLVLHGLAGVLWQTPSQMLLHDIVKPEELRSAVRLNATARSLGVLVGPALGGALLLGLGPSLGIFVNALFYLPLVLWLWKAPYGAHYRGEPPAPRAIKGFADIWRTAGEVASNRLIAPMVMLAGAASFFIGNSYHAQMPGFATDLGHGHADASYSALLAADAAGALLAGFLLERLSLLQPKPTSALLLAAVWAAALGCFSLAPGYEVALVLLFIAGFFELSFSSMAQTLVQIHAPAAIRGRVLGLYNMAALGMRMFSGITVGLLGSQVGVHLSLALCACALLLVIGGLVWRYRPGSAVTVT